MNLEEFIMSNEKSIRMGFFFGVLVMMALWEIAAPRRKLTVSKTLRWIVVTPDMHRVHHSVEDDEANSNFGFSLTWWDRLFGTYRNQPRGGHKEMTIGIHNYRDTKDVSWITGMLLLPFRGKISEYAINRRQWSGANEVITDEK